MFRPLWWLKKVSYPTLSLVGFFFFFFFFGCCCYYCFYVVVCFQNTNVSDFCSVFHYHWSFFFFLFSFFFFFFVVVFCFCFCFCFVILFFCCCCYFCFYVVVCFQDTNVSDFCSLFLTIGPYYYIVIVKILLAFVCCDTQGYNDLNTLLSGSPSTSLTQIQIAAPHPVSLPIKYVTIRRKLRYHYKHCKFVLILRAFSPGFLPVG